MMLALAACALLAGIALLIILTIIDFKTMLLPDKYVAAYAACGLLFHGLFGFGLIGWEQMVLGAAAGGGFLALIRWGGNIYYQQESMGLGDVKLMIAGGLWLGVYWTIMAITLGAVITLVQATVWAWNKARKEGKKLDLSRLEVPAGPGFCLALIILSLLNFRGLFGL